MNIPNIHICLWLISLSLSLSVYMFLGYVYFVNSCILVLIWCIVIWTLKTLGRFQTLSKLSSKGSHLTCAVILRIRVALFAAPKLCIRHYASISDMCPWYIKCYLGCKETCFPRVFFLRSAWAIYFRERVITCGEMFRVSNLEKAEWVRLEITQPKPHLNPSVPYPTHGWD